MRTPDLSSIRRLAALSALLLFSTVSHSAQADMLPMIVDQTQAGAPGYWWSTAQPRPQGVIDANLFEGRVVGIVRPDRLQNFAVSRIFQRPDISVVNAQQLAQMSGSTSFFLGVANAETVGVGWLGSTAAVVTIRGALYDTRSGATLGDVEIVGRGVSTSSEHAVQIAARSASKDLLNFRPGAARAEDANAPLEVILRVHDRADAFVALRDHFVRALEGRGDIGECRASEGEVVLCVRALPGQDLTELRRIILQSLRSPFPDVILEEVREDEHHVFVRARSTPMEPTWGQEGALPR